jgi:hypothetical protein
MATAKRKGVGDAPTKTTQRVNLQIDAEAYERLLIHAIKGKAQPGAIVSRLIDEHLREWRVQANRTTRAMPELSVNLDGPVEEMHAEAA